MAVLKERLKISLIIKEKSFRDWPGANRTILVITELPTGNCRIELRPRGWLCRYRSIVQRADDIGEL